MGAAGVSVNAYGLYGVSTNSAGVYGISTNSYAGYFVRNTASPSAVPVCYVLQDHASDTNTAFAVRNDGTGYIQAWYNESTLRAEITSAGKFGIGVTTPTAFMHLAAGTATAATAPLKFTNGVNLTAVEAGTVEFSSCHWMSDNVSSRQAIVGCGCAQYAEYDVHVVE